MQKLTRKPTIKTRNKTKLEKGYILYRGESVLNGAPVVAILTTKSSNIKTGDMAQIWILSDQVSPIEASKQKLDSSVCGNCPLRQNLGGSCYVTLFQGPNQVYKSYKKGLYKDISKTDTLPNELKALLSYKAVRFGAYGDPAAIPFEVWQKVLNNSKAGYTAYTHQVKHKNFDNRLLDFCMVSTETIKNTEKAQKLGRTFRVVPEGGHILDNEIVCPNYDQGVSCVDCLKCDGNLSDNKQNIVILSHGIRAKKHDKKYLKSNLIKTVNI